MKKLVLALIMVLSLGAGVKAFADGVGASTLGSPITLLDDTSILGAFPSRLQTVGSAKSAVYVTAAGGSLGIAGFDLKLSQLADICYTYRNYLTTIPSVLAANTLLFSGTEQMSNPIYVIYGIKMGPLQFGISYDLKAYNAEDVSYYNNGSVSVKYHGNYQAHTIQPGITLRFGDTAALDVSFKGILQVLNNFTTNSVTDTENYWHMAAPLSTMDLLAQFTVNLNPSFTIAVRGDAYHANNGYNQISSIAGVFTTNETSQYVDAFAATIGLQYKPVDMVTLFAKFITSASTTVNAATIVKSYALLPSTTIGIEVKAGNWRFRGYGSYINSKSVTESYAAGYTGPAISTSVNANSYGGGLGIGWVKLPWAINASISTDLLNDTIYIISGTPVTPIASIQVNYLFDIPGFAPAGH